MEKATTQCLRTSFLALAALFAAAAVSGCASTEPQRSACAVGSGDSAITLDLTAADCTRLQTAFTAQQQDTVRTAAAAAEADRAEAARRYKAEVVARSARDEQSGYRTTRFDAFQVNGRQLAQSDAMVAVEGVYLKTARGEFLMPSTVAAAEVDKVGRADQGVLLLTGDADRAAKQFFMQCRADTVGAQLGCPATILGHATLCERMTVVGRAEVPCLAVTSSWYIHRPTTAKAD